MNQQSPAPESEPAVRAPDSPSLKALSLAARLLLWLVLLAWGLFALAWATLHLAIVPRIDEWRPDLERWASRAVGVPVRVGAIRAESAGTSRGILPGLIPAFELSDVRLYDPAGREALHLPRVGAAVSVRSLLGLGFEQLVLVEPVLDVRRTAQGRILVAGLDLSGPGTDDGRAADWFFEQAEFVIQRGTLRWTDERRAQPPLALSDLDFVARNHARRHLFRLDATPPPEWGDRFSLRGQLREPLLDLPGRGNGQARWHDWGGELFADLGRVDVSRLGAHVDLSEWGVSVFGGRGAVRAWADVSKGRIAGVTADLALADVETRLGPQLPPLAIETLQGRLSASWSEAGFAWASDDLRFRTLEGQVWPGGRLRLDHSRPQAGRAANTVLSAERLELAPLAAIAGRLPLSSATHALLAELRPAGHVEDLRARWQAGSDGAGPRYQASGRVRDLALAGKPSGQLSVSGRFPLPGRPGVTGAAVQFELDQDGGQARLQVNDGTLELPDVFEEPLLPLQQLQAQARWRLQGERIDVWLDSLRLRNADTEGTGRAHWHTGDPATSPARSRFPGVLDVEATLTRADGTRVHRYLPLTVAPEARRYVREAVRAGASARVDFRIRGEVWDMPFETPDLPGEFRIAAALSDVDFAYVPGYLQSAGDAPWPALRGVDGELVLDRNALRISGLEAGLEGAPGVRLSQASVAIADLVHTPTLTVSAKAQGPAAELLGFVRASPLNAMTGQALARARIGGNAGVQFRLDLPLDRIDATRVQGTVQLAGNDLQISPDAPLLARTSGSLSFSESGFSVAGAQARLYGGDVRFDGGMRPDVHGVPRIQFRGQGTVSADGLRDARLGFVSRIFAHATGGTAYSAQLGFRGGQPELLVTSSLQGLAVNLPPPLQKAAADVLPLRYENAVLSTLPDLDGETALTDRLSVELGSPLRPLAALRYERDLRGAEPRVLRGSMAVGLGGGESAPLPAQGVLGNLHAEQLDVDAWERAFNSTNAADPRPGVGAATLAPASGDASLAYLPTQLALRTDRLTLGGRRFNQVVVGGSREGTLWRANIDAEELSGYIEYRQPQGAVAGSVYARLARMNLAPGAASEVEQILQQPSTVPALDIEVEDLQLAGRRLGRAQIEAVNRSGASRLREWRLTRLNLTVPEARLSASGNWAPVGTDPGGRRRTALSFTLDVDDSGQLLARFGREATVRGGKGRITGNIGWLGSPLSPDMASLSGQLRADIERGQFLKVEPGAAKLLGVLSLQALPRRLVLDFRDVFSEGFAFDFVRGDARIEQGVIASNNLQMKGVNAAVLMDGSADIGRETQDLKVVVVPEINAGTASLIATAINPAVGLGSFLAQFLLRQPLQSATTQEFHITGSWADPKVEKIDRRPSNPQADKPAALK